MCLKIKLFNQMKSFFKTFFASLLAIIVAVNLMVILSIIGLAVFGSLLTSETKSVIEDNSILKLTFSTPIKDNPEQDQIGLIDLSTFEVAENISLLKTVTLIEAAKNDSKIKGIYIDPSFFAQSGFATIEELRNALIDFKKSGKFIVSYADNFSQGAYYLCSVSDDIYMNEVGTFGLKGLSSTITFYKGLLDKLGVDVQIVRHGEYKSFVEPFTSTEMSPKNKEQIESLVGSVWDNILTKIADVRGVEKNELSNMVSSLEISDPEIALKKGLIDGLKYSAEMTTHLMSLVGVSDKDDLKIVDLKTYSSTISRLQSKNKIALIYAEGDIMYGRTNTGGIITNIDIIDKFKRAREDDDVKAIVLRINSGGGSALAAELMWREIEQTRAVKPVIVSLGDAAASGGYYIAVASDAIVCSENTITGSIGVFSIFPNIGNALKDKLGITTQTIQTNEGASIMNPYRAMTEHERRIIQKSTDKVYNTFVERVAKGRNLTLEQVDSIAGGRVWSGSQAVEIGLVDGIGGINHAIMLAAERAAIQTDYQFFTVISKKTFMQEMLESISSAKAKFMYDDFVFSEMTKIKNAIDVEPVQAKMPYTLQLETK